MKPTTCSSNKGDEYRKYLTKKEVTDIYSSLYGNSVLAESLIETTAKIRGYVKKPKEEGCWVKKEQPNEKKFLYETDFKFL